MPQQQSVAAIPVEQLGWMLAGAYDPILSRVVSEAKQGYPESRIYTLPNSVRVPCWADYDYHFPSATCREGQIRPECGNCYGLGYTPSGDLAVWVNCWPQLTLRHAIFPEGLLGRRGGQRWIASFPCPNTDHKHSVARVPTEGRCASSEASEPLEAVQRALCKILQEKGAVIGGCP